jgi:hypothetical protein
MRPKKDAGLQVFFGVGLLNTKGRAPSLGLRNFFIQSHSQLPRDVMVTLLLGWQVEHEW